MRANYKNIGLIADAEIELNGITVIAAPNNSGKSSLSKTLYMFLETLNSFQEEYDAFRLRIIEEQLDAFFRLLSRKLTSSDKEKLILQFKDKILSSDTVDLLEIKFNEEADALHMFFNLRWFQVEGRDSDLIKNIELLQEICYELNIENEDLVTLENLLLHFESSEVEQMKLVLKSKLRSYFDKDLVSRNEEKAYFSLLDNQSEFDPLRILECEFNNDEVDSLKSQPSLNEFRNILYLDSFVDLETYNFGRRVRYLLLRNDIRGKSTAKFQSLVDFKDDVNPLRTDTIIQDELLLEITNIIGGDIERTDGRIVYTKDSRQFSLKNTATGIKMFGALQLLLRNYQMTSDLFLIVDEPETNLHPVWQVKLAKIIVLLNQKLGTRFMINSHSANFIEGVKLYSELYGSEDIVKFYLINQSNTDSNFLEDATDDVERIYDHLNGSLDLLDEIAEEILNKNRGGSYED